MSRNPKELTRMTALLCFTFFRSGLIEEVAGAFPGSPSAYSWGRTNAGGAWHLEIVGKDVVMSPTTASQGPRLDQMDIGQVGRHIGCKFFACYSGLLSLSCRQSTRCPSAGLSKALGPILSKQPKSALTSHHNYQSCELS